MTWILFYALLLLEGGFFFLAFSFIICEMSEYILADLQKLLAMCISVGVILILIWKKINLLNI